MKLLIPLAAAAIFAAAPASAQDVEITVERLQNAMNNHFGEGGDISLLTAGGDPGTPGAWSMRRRITGASNPKRCSIKIDVPTVLENQGGTPASSYTMDWAQVTDISWDQDRNIRFRLPVMAAGEFAELRVETADEGRMVFSVVKFLARECAKGQ